MGKLTLPEEKDSLGGIQTFIDVSVKLAFGEWLIFQYWKGVIAFVLTTDNLVWYTFNYLTRIALDDVSNVPMRNSYS